MQQVKNSQGVFKQENFKQQYFPKCPLHDTPCSEGYISQ